MRTILVADEDNRVWNIFRLIFTANKGYRVISASNGKDAVLKAKQIKPDIVIAAVSLADKDGYQISREIKSDLSLKDTSVLLINSAFESFDKEKALNACAVDVITKPFGTEIVQKIESLINQHENGETTLTSILHPLEVSKKMNSAKIAILSEKHRKLNKSIEQKPFDIIIRSLKAQSLKGRLVGLSLVTGALVATFITFSNIKEENIFPLNNGGQEFEESGLNSESSFNFREPRAGSGNITEVTRIEKIAVPQREGRKASDELKKVKTEEQRPKLIEKSTEELKGNKYVVKVGDNLSAIAKRFNTSIKELRVVNKLRGNKILIGQVLEVPNVAEVGPTAEVGLKKKNHEPVIKITGSSFFVALGGIAIHSFNIENKDDIAYKDIKVRVRYFSNARTEVGSKTLVLPIIIPPNRSRSYTNEGELIQDTSNGAYGSTGAYSAKIEFLGATPVIDVASEGTIGD